MVIAGYFLRISSRVFLSGFWLLSAFAVHSQSLINYSISQGLPSNEVYSIYQDVEGFLWFATDNGVVRYNGSEMKILHIKDGLTDPVVFSFYEDESKNIWLRTFSGRLCYFDIKEGKIIDYKFNDRISEMVKTGILFSMGLDKHKTMWLSSGGITGVLIKIDTTGNVSREDLTPKSFTFKALDKGELLGFNPTNGELKHAIINDIDFPIEISKSKLPSYVICSSYVENKLFFSIGLDLFVYENGKVKKVLVTEYPIISLSKDKNDCLWIGHLNNGVERLVKGASQPERFPLLSKNSVTKVLEDSEHGYWFSTLENGVFYLPNKNIKTLPFFSDSKVKSVIAAFNYIIVGDQKGELTYVNPYTRKISSSMSLVTPVMSSYMDHNGRLWVSTNNSITLFDKKDHPIKSIKGQSKVDFTSNGSDSIWSTGAASSLFDIRGNPLKHYLVGFNRAILAVDSLLFLAGKIGLEVRSKNYDPISNPGELRNVKIRKIDLLNDTTILLSTIGNGPILMNPFTLKTNWLANTRKFPADNIYAAVKSDSALWFGTEKGLYKVNLESLLNEMTPFQHISKQSGLLDDKVDYMVGVKDELWIFSDNGISIVPFNTHAFDNQNPTFYLKDLYINDKKFKVANNQSIKVHHQENYIRFDIGFISFNNQNIKVRFKIKDSDDWSYTSNKSIELFSLSPGHYNINLEFSANSIVWSTGIKNLSIYIKPPWWRLWYYQLVLGMLVISWIVFFIFTRISLFKQKQIYLQSVTNHQQQLIKSEIESIEKERIRIAKDLHDGIGTTLTSVKMRINQLLSQYNPSEANTIEARLKDILKEVKNIIYDLTPPALMQFGLHEGLKNYIEKVGTDTPVQIKLNIFGNDIRQPKIELFIFRVIQELVVNSLKHSNAKNITIHLNTFDDLLNVLYQDDGTGFIGDHQPIGHGLYNIESRVQALNGKMLFETTPKGVSYSIDIPL